MLRRVGPNLFQATTGETVTIAAIAQSNNGVEAATFRYGTTQLATRQVQNHPGCDFTVQAGTATFGAVVVFDPGSPNARYELFEEDDSNILQPLGIVARPLFGPIVQFQVAAIPVAAAAGAVTEVAKKTARETARKAAKTTARKAAKKTAKKAAKKTGKKTAKAVGKTARKASKKTSKKTASTGAKKTARSTAKAAKKRRPR